LLLLLISLTAGAAGMSRMDHSRNAVKDIRAW
jgi:hypothetical protein